MQTDRQLLTQVKQHQRLDEWNDAKAVYPRGQCIHDLFGAQAEKTPDAVAMVFEDRHLTYRELARRTNQLAHHLRALGVGPEVIVGICLDRSLEMVIGILGIIKAGGAYLPLDPAYPKERLAFMLEDAQAPVLLTQKKLMERLPKEDGGLKKSIPTIRNPKSQFRNRSFVFLDTDWPAISQQSDQNPRSKISSENLTYVIYTSGSTGMPKGVMITHTNLCHFVQAVRTTLGITSDDVYLLTGSIGYALSVRQLMTPLCTGASLIIATSEQIRDPLALFDLIKRQGVTMMDFVPSYWRHCNRILAELDSKSRLDLLDNSLRQIVCVGEPLLSDVPRKWTFGFKHGARLVNIFGQTETTGIVAAFPIPTKYEDQVKVIPIGLPIINTQLYILDSTMQPVTMGAPGELCVSSTTLARGYLNQPKLTAQKFIPNPFSQEKGARLYKTGDLARYLPDGNIKLLGRMDRQVKIRGIRIELEEIEAVLGQYPSVRETVVVAKEKTPGDQHLVAYLVSDSEDAPTISELRRILRQKLPDYMVPSIFVMLDALPLTPNGKVDYQALPAPTKASLKPAYDVVTRQVSSEKIDIADSFYVPSWKRYALPKAVELGDLTHQKTCWLVFVDSCGLASQIVTRLEQRRHYVIKVIVGKQFSRVGDRVYEINPRQRNDYGALLRELCALDITPKTILHIWNVTATNLEETEIDFLEKFQDQGFYSLLFLAQALQNQNSTETFHICVVSNSMQEVTGEEVLCPAKATLLGPCKVIPQECPNITCRSVDIVLPKSGTRNAEKLTDQLIAELAVKGPETVIAYRGNYRWVQTFEAVHLNVAVERPLRLRENGVYLITGGLGGIGLELAKYLARTVRAKLVLTGRSAFLEKNRWERWLTTHDDKDKVSRKIRKLQALEKLATEVLLISADVANQEQMQAVITRTYERFGSIHGAIHSAGVRDVFNPFQEKTRDIASRILTPKVKGTLVLNSVLMGSKLDFIVLCSSISSILGRVGQVDYCAANAFLDGFAHRNTKDGTFTVSINWDTWQEVGMAVDTVVPATLKKLRDEKLRTGILSKEGGDAFSRILCSALPQVVVSKQDPQARIEQQNIFLASGIPKELVKSRLSKPEYQRYQLVAPRTPVEKMLVGIWAEVLRVDRVGIHDNFFELGGHSILATLLISRIRNTFDVEVPLRTFFNAPTLADLAVAIVHSQAEKTDHNELACTLAEVEALSDEEAQRLLAQKRQQKEI